MSGPVKWFSSENFNAPQLTNTWGDLVHALKTCLIDGFGDQDIISVVISNGVGVATFANNHNLQMFQWIKLSGSSNSVLNDEFRILGATLTTIEFLIDLPDQTITETLSCRLTPLGWSMPFSDTGRAVFQAKDTSKNPYYLRVDDTCDPLHTPTRAKFAKVGILESCTGIDDISGNQAPFDPELPTKNWIGTGTGGTALIGWARWVYASADNSTSNGSWAFSSNAIDGIRKWIFVGDDTCFYILPAILHSTSTSPYKENCLCYGFGIFEGLDCPYLSCTHNYQALNVTNSSGTNATFSGSGGGYLCLLKNRNGTYVQNATMEQADLRLKYGFNTSGFTGYSNIYQSNSSDGPYYHPFVATDQNTAFLGNIPLAQCVLSGSPTSLTLPVVLSDGGRALLRVKHMGSSTRYGSIIFDLGEI